MIGVFPKMRGGRRPHPGCALFVAILGVSPSLWFLDVIDFVIFPYITPISGRSRRNLSPAILIMSDSKFEELRG